MEVKTVTAVYFSPTGGTKNLADMLAAKLAEEHRSLDVTVSAEDTAFTAGDVAVLAVPVFGGRVPTPTAERLRHLSGNGAAAVLLVVFGNRAYEDALMELRDLAAARGFRCIAGGAFVARHSICPEFGAGRPDAQDKIKLDAFVESVRQRLAGDLTEVDLPGNHAYRSFSGLPMKPSADVLKCGKCGACAKNCPVGAIPVSDPRKTDAKKCITCMRCISVCPHYARRLNPIMRMAVRKKLAPVCTARVEPEWF